MLQTQAYTDVETWGTPLPVMSVPLLWCNALFERYLKSFFVVLIKIEFRLAAVLIHSSILCTCFIHTRRRAAVINSLVLFCPLVFNVRWYSKLSSLCIQLVPLKDQVMDINLNFLLLVRLCFTYTPACAKWNIIIWLQFCEMIPAVVLQLLCKLTFWPLDGSSVTEF